MVGFAFVFMWLSHSKRWQIVFWSAVVGAFVLLGMIRHVPVKNKEANHEKQIVVMVQKPLNTNSFGHQYIVKNQDDNERLLLARSSTILCPWITRMSDIGFLLMIFLRIFHQMEF